MSSARSITDLVAILRADYAKFPQDQTYEIYAPEVYFKDPLNEFRGVEKYQSMIKLLARWFRAIALEVNSIEQTDNLIKTEWTLNMTSPLPWQPRLSIPGWSELEVSEDNLIVAHIDHWHISVWSVWWQNFFSTQKASQ